MRPLSGPLYIERRRRRSSKPRALQNGKRLSDNSSVPFPMRTKTPPQTNLLPYRHQMHARELIELARWSRSRAGPGPKRPTIPAGGIEQVLDEVPKFAWTVGARMSERNFSRQCDADSRLRGQNGLNFAACSRKSSPARFSRGYGPPCFAYDRTRGVVEAEPVARSVMLGHSEARHRVLTLWSAASGIDARTPVKLNRLRRHAERWTDLLVGRLPNSGHQRVRGRSEAGDGFRRRCPPARL